jgi:hypothetical protein
MTMLAPRLNEGRHREASRWCEPGVVSGQPCQGRSARCGQVGHSLEPRGGNPNTTRGVRASMDCPITSEPGMDAPLPRFYETDTRSAGTSGRNGACAIGGPAQNCAPRRHSAAELAALANKTRQLQSGALPPRPEPVEGRMKCLASTSSAPGRRGPRPPRPRRRGRTAPCRGRTPDAGRARRCRARRTGSAKTGPWSAARPH